MKRTLFVALALILLLVAYVGWVYAVATYGTPQEIGSTGTSGWDNAWADFDGDGDLDFVQAQTATSGYAANDGGNKQNDYYRNNGDGTFTEITLNLDNLPSYAAAAADYDGDGDMDVAIGNVGQNYLYINDGSANFTASAQFGTGSTTNVAWGDCNGDGHPDLAVANRGTGYTDPGQNYLYINNGNGTFTGRAEFGGDATYHITWVDYDGDGDLDAAVANYGQNYLYVNDGSCNFTAQAAFGNRRTQDIEFGDLDGDGDLDAVVANGTFGMDDYASNIQNQICWNNGGSFSCVDALGAYNSQSASIGDTDRDGDLDVIITNHTDSQPSVLYDNDGNGNFTAYNLSGTAQGSDKYWKARGQLVDITGNGMLDYAVAQFCNHSDCPAAIWLQNQTPPPVDLADHLMAEYRFSTCGTDHPASTADASGHLPDGVLRGNAQITDDGEGKIYRAYEGDGSNGTQMTVGDHDNGTPDDPSDDTLTNPALDILGDLTLSAWIYPYGYPGWVEIIVSRSHEGEFWFGRDSDGYLVYAHNSGDMVTSSAQVPANEWHHVALVRTGTSGNYVLKFYVDGVLRDTKTYNQSIQATDHVLEIGSCQFVCGGLNFNGKIDEVKIFDAAASGAQINEIYTNENAGKNYDGSERCPATSLGDFVWNDADADGIQDAGEAGIPNVTVELYNGDSCSGSAVATTTTDGSGHYSFTDLAPGTYSVKFVKPSGYAFSPVNQGSDDSVDSDADPATGCTGGIDLSSGENDTAWDAGMYLAATLGDFVWHDKDIDGIQDPDEEGIWRAKVELYNNGSCSGDPIATTYTDDTGHYAFGGLPAGTYSIRFYDKSAAGYNQFSKPNQGSDDSIDSDADQRTHCTGAITLNAGETDNTWDAGLHKLAYLSGRVWYDSDKDGVQDPLETDIFDLRVELYDNGLCSGTPITVTTTRELGSDGNYRFDPEVGGTYSIKFVKPDDTFTFSPKDVGSDDAVDSDADPTIGCVTNIAFDDSVGAFHNDAGLSSFCRVEYVIPATHAAWIDSENPDTSYYDLSPIHLRAKPDDTEYGQRQDSFYYFDLSDYATETAEHAALLIDMIDNPDPTNWMQGSVFMELLHSDWDGTPITWNSAPPSHVGLTQPDTDDIAAPLQTYDFTEGTRVFQMFSPPVGEDEVSYWFRLCPCPACLFEEVHADHQNPRLYLRVNMCADLSVTKSDSPDPVNTGSVLTYTITVANAGPANAKNVVITDTLPAQLRGPLYSLDNGTTWNPWTGTLNVGDVPTTTTKSVLIRATVDPSTSVPSITNTVSVGSADNPDPDTSNNSDSETTGIVVLTPHLLIDKDTSTPTTVAGGEATYTIVVRNDGTGVARGVVITDTLPNGFTYDRTISVEISGPVTRTGTITPVNTLLDDTGYIYAFGGKNTPNFWRYDLEAGTWQVMADAPGNVHAGGDIAMADGYIFGMGGGSTNAFWRYDPTSNTWSDAAAADVPLPPGKEVGTGGALTYDDRYVYAIVGGNDSSTDNDLWRYDPRTDTWTLLTHTPVAQSGGSDITYGDGYIYFLGGNNGNDDPSQWGPENPGYEFYRYNIQTDTWERLHDLPNVEPAKEGAAIVFHPGTVLGNQPSSGSIYAWVGGDTQLYYRYDIATDTWIQNPPADSPYKVENGSDLCSDGKHQVYGFPATDTRYFQVYDTNADNWSQLTQTPAQVHDGGSLLCALGNGTPKWGTWDIGAGGAITITFVVDVSPDTPEGTYDNTAYASAENYHTVDDDGTQAQDTDTPSGQDPENDEDVTVSTARGSIGDRVWNDTDADGVQDAGESGLSGVTVKLYTGDSCSGSVVASTTTDSSGNYTFTNLAAGTYSVEFVLPSGYVFTLRNAVSDDTVDSDADPSTGCTGAIDLSAGENDTSWDAGMHLAPEVSVTKLVPEQDGVEGNVVLVGSTVNFQVIITNTGSTTLAYVPLHDAYDTTCLQYTAKSADPPENQQSTGTMDWLDLTISFSRDLAPGESFTVTIPFHAVAPDDEATNTATVHGARDVSDAVAPDASSSASVVCRQPASIGDRVWNDTNNNQVQDTGENGINGVTVRLYKDDGDNVFEPGTDDVLVATQTTSGDGNYDFTMLHAGTYWVDVDGTTVPSGYELTTANDPKKVTVDYGDDYNDADFGYVGRGDISGTVFYDWDEDGQQDAGEDGIGNVRVCLYLDDGDDTYDSGDTLQECKNTSADGGYVFEDYLPGTYFVVEDQPAGLDSTTPNVRKVDLVVVGPSGSSTDNNFGEIVKGRIGDFVWVDSDGDGVQDAGETSGVANIPLHITGLNIINETVDVTVTTSITGYYMVEDLLPGTYTVTAPANYGGFIRTSSSPRTTTLSVGDMEDLTLDFGYISPTGFELVRFEAHPAATQVELLWAIRNSGATPEFYVWRRSSNGRWVRLTEDAVPPETMTGWEIRYRFVDETAQPGQTYLYRLETQDGQTFGPWEVKTLDPGNGGSGRTYLPMIMSAP